MYIVFFTWYLWGLIIFPLPHPPHWFSIESLFRICHYFSDTYSDDTVCYLHGTESRLYPPLYICTTEVLLTIFLWTATMWKAILREFYHESLVFSWLVYLFSLLLIIYQLLIHSYITSDSSLTCKLFALRRWLSCVSLATILTFCQQLLQHSSCFNFK